MFLTELREEALTVNDSLSYLLEPSRIAKKTVIVEWACRTDSEIGKQAEKLGCLGIRFTRLSHDLSTASGVSKALTDIKANPGCHLWISLPCTVWSTLQHLNVSIHGPEYAADLEKRRKHALKMLRYAIIAAREVRKNGGKVGFEWPTGALGWVTKECQQMIKELEMFITDFHGCNVGLKSKKNPELALKKPWTIASDSEEVLKAFAPRQCTGDHTHDLCEGGNAEQSGYYPPEMARMIVRAFAKEDVKKRIEDYKEKIQAAEQTAAAATQEEEEAFKKLPEKDKKRLSDAAKKIHVNTGHRPPAELARMLREKKAPLESRAAMEKVTCDTCRENEGPKPAPVATMDTSRIPFQVIGIDVKETNDGKFKDKWLIIVDEATRLTRAIHLFQINVKDYRNMKSEELMYAFISGWEDIFGLPKTIRHDPEGSMMSHLFLEDVEKRCEA